MKGGSLLKLVRAYFTNQIFRLLCIAVFAEEIAMYNIICAVAIWILSAFIMVSV
jgi:hypothetical protein